MSSDIEQVIEASLREHLHAPEATVHGDFFALGGDSLIAVSIMETVESQFGIEFPLEVLLGTGDLDALVAECRLRAQPPA